MGNILNNLRLESNVVSVYFSYGGTEEMNKISNYKNFRSLMHAVVLYWVSRTVHGWCPTCSKRWSGFLMTTIAHQFTVSQVIFVFVNYFSLIYYLIPYLLLFNLLRYIPIMVHKLKLLQLCCNPGALSSPTDLVSWLALLGLFSMG